MSGNRKGSDGSSEFWKDRQAEFEKYAKQYPTLEADWNAADREWRLNIPGTTRETRWGLVPDCYSVPQECKGVFNAIARKAATKLPRPSVTGEAEPWRLWLDIMRERGWGFRDTGSPIACTELLFPFCDSSEQARITDYVASVDSGSRLGWAFLGILNSIKQGLMHDLLSGRVRVCVEEPS
jgi:hypothetical protein